ncbi:DUF3224 domain-containing protein [Gallaecimonas mangrovi]|uniref:DUF3224 domain-containing protein n=1 Tax=Gallaecimonas mangrovi TaxID=2291597 RepID=UPI000E1FFF76|nr:DUF3224 domain-containing protein [Gallaecimonas mangrovi]
MTHSAIGTFEVKVRPQQGAPGQLARMLLDKIFVGDLAGNSQGQMLSFGDPGSGFAGYVAMEVVKGTLGGRHGSFALMHYGTMNKGKQQLRLSVVPGSGTEQLVGLSGQMDIAIEDGLHQYRFQYLFE